MTGFNPEVTEEEWLQDPPADVWPLWRSMPVGGSRNSRKYSLLMVALLRQIADLLTDPRPLNIIDVTERAADGQTTESEHDAATQQVEAVYDEVEQPTRVADRAVAAARCIAYASYHDAAQIIEYAVGLRAALQSGYEEDREAHNRVEVRAAVATHGVVMARLIRDIFGNPFRPVTFSPSWRTDTAIALARTMYESREFSAMPILADALQDAGCDHPDILTHCRDPQQTHVRGCWVVDLVLGKG